MGTNDVQWVSTIDTNGTEVPRDTALCLSRFRDSLMIGTWRMGVEEPCMQDKTSLNDGMV